MNQKIKIYHNPKCSKSRQSLELLRSKGIEPEIIEYQKTGISKEEIKDLLKKLNLKPLGILRDHSETFNDAPDDLIIEMITNNPSVMQRPIIVNKEKAVIGRPPENVLEIL